MATKRSAEDVPASPKRLKVHPNEPSTLSLLIDHGQTDILWQISSYLLSFVDLYNFGLTCRSTFAVAKSRFIQDKDRYISAITCRGCGLVSISKTSVAVAVRCPKSGIQTSCALLFGHSSCRKDWCDSQIAFCGKCYHALAHGGYSYQLSAGWFAPLKTCPHINEMAKDAFGSALIRSSMVSHLVAHVRESKVAVEEGTYKRFEATPFFNAQTHDIMALLLGDCTNPSCDECCHISSVNPRIEEKLECLF